MMPEMQTRQKGKICWHFQKNTGESQLPDLLFENLEKQVQIWKSTGQASIVKHGQHRTVYRIVLPGMDFHLKYYPLNNTRAWLRQCVRPSKGKSEFLRTLAVTTRGVPTLQPVAFGETGLFVKSSYLITKTLPDVVSLDHFLEKDLPFYQKNLQEIIRQKVAIELGRFVAHLHHHGITHLDLHPGNILFQLSKDHTPHFYLIDLHSIQVGNTLNWDKSRENLVLFNRWFIMRTNQPERLRFFRSYLDHRKKLACNLPSSGRPVISPWNPSYFGEREVEEATVASNLKFWKHHDYRCTSSNRYFTRITHSGIEGYSVTDLDNGFLESLKSDPDFPFKNPAHPILKDSSSSRIIEMAIPFRDGIHHLVYKRFEKENGLLGLIKRLRHHPALRSYQMGHALRWRGLPTPRPLLVLLSRNNNFEGSAYLLTEKLPDSLHLQGTIQQTCQLGVNPYRNLIHRLARLIASLHDRRMAQRDLKANNIVGSSRPWKVIHPDRPESDQSSESPPLPGPHLWLVDLVGVSHANPVSHSTRIKNLMRLNVSFYNSGQVTRTDRLRFLRSYLGWGIDEEIGWKEWWKKIEKATESKVSRNRRLGRPIG